MTARLLWIWFIWLYNSTTPAGVLAFTITFRRTCSSEYTQSTILYNATVWKFMMCAIAILFIKRYTRGALQCVNEYRLSSIPVHEFLVWDMLGLVGNIAKTHTGRVRDRKRNRYHALVGKMLNVFMFVSSWCTDNVTARVCAYIHDKNINNEERRCTLHTRLELTCGLIELKRKKTSCVAFSAWIIVKIYWHTHERNLNPLKPVTLTYI